MKTASQKIKPWAYLPGFMGPDSLRAFVQEPEKKSGGCLISFPLPNHTETLESARGIVYVCALSCVCLFALP